MGLGSGILDPGSGKNLFRIPDPVSRGQKGPGSATLVLSEQDGMHRVGRPAVLDPVLLRSQVLLPGPHDQFLGSITLALGIFIYHPVRMILLHSYVNNRDIHRKKKVREFPVPTP